MSIAERVDAFQAAWGIGVPYALRVLWDREGWYGSALLQAWDPPPVRAGENLAERLLIADRSHFDLLFAGSVPVATDPSGAFLGLALYSSPFGRRGDLIGADPRATPWPFAVRPGFVAAEVDGLVEELWAGSVLDVVDRASLGLDVPTWCAPGGSHPFLEVVHALLRPDFGCATDRIGEAGPCFPALTPELWARWSRRGARNPPRALYLLFRCLVLREWPELEEVIAACSACPSRVLRDAARLVAELRDGRRVVGQVADIEDRLRWMSSVLRPTHPPARPFEGRPTIIPGQEARRLPSLPDLRRRGRA